MAYVAACHSDPGRARSRNEDASLLLRWELTGHGAPSPMLLAAVADGMGGHGGGHLASALTVRTLAAAVVEQLRTLPAGTPPVEAHLMAALQAAVAACEAEVNTASAGPEGPMGSTLATALLWENRLLVANVGDSRVYLAHEQLQQITADHSLVAQLVARGELTPAAARSHPRRNEIYRMIGFGRSAQPDLFALDVKAGDLVLLCSDGLCSLVPDEGIFAVLNRRGLSEEERCRLLVDLANAAGGEDNITALLVGVGPAPAPAAVGAAREGTA